MGSATTTGTPVRWLSAFGDTPPDEPVPCLIVVWSAREPGRLGEAAFPDPRGGVSVLGRGPAESGDDGQRLTFGRHRPDSFESTGPLESPSLSRRQLRITVEDGGLTVERTGRARLAVNGGFTESAAVKPGDTVAVENELVLLCSLRAPRMPALQNLPRAAGFGFGEADRAGLVGESPEAWRLRDEAAFHAQGDGHVLVSGPTGAGKELIARALHELSSRKSKALLTRNAATFPPGLIDAELFGNVRDYPNPPMRERAGLIGEADGGTLFLDEIGELPQELQAHLLRVLDRGGEYQRLGDSQVRRSDLRLVAATNRPLDELKHDFLARFSRRISLSGLEDRREDVPLLTRLLLERAAKKNPQLGQRFFEPSGEPRVAPQLAEALVRHRYTQHVRELDALLWASMSSSRGTFLALTPEVEERITPAAAPADPRALTPQQIQACLDRNGGSVSKAWRELGLSSRDALNRLVKKHGLVTGRSQR